MTGEGKILKTGDCFSIICMQCGIPTCKQDFIINSQKLHNCCCSRHSDARDRFWSQAFSSLASSMSGWMETRGDTGQNGRHNSLHLALGKWIGFILNWCRDKIYFQEWKYQNRPPHTFKSTHIDFEPFWSADNLFRGKNILTCPPAGGRNEWVDPGDVSLLL